MLLKDLNAIYNECIADLVSYGITPPAKKPRLIIDKCAKNRWGQAKTLGEDKFIKINHRLLMDDVSDYGATNCMMHEILHICAPGERHGGKWAKYALSVNRASNGKYYIKRGSTSEEYGVQKIDDYKYHFRCKKCGTIIGRYRASKFTRNPGLYMHDGCGGTFEEV